MALVTGTSIGIRTATTNTSRCSNTTTSATTSSSRRGEKAVACRSGITWKYQMNNSNELLHAAANGFVKVLMGSEPIEMLTRFAPHFYAWCGPKGENNLFKTLDNWMNTRSLSLPDASR